MLLAGMCAAHGYERLAGPSGQSLGQTSKSGRSTVSNLAEEQLQGRFPEANKMLSCFHYMLKKAQELEA